jgi:hypothetical protein
MEGIHAWFEGGAAWNAEHWFYSSVWILDMILGSMLSYAEYSVVHLKNK